jgi:hypothetical protein
MYDRLSFSEFHCRVEAAARIHDGEVHHLSNGATQIQLGDVNLPTICFLSGLHGDERSGPIALLNILERKTLALPKAHGLIIFPLINDIGWDTNRREWNEIDLNRSFGLPHAPKFLMQIADEFVRLRPSGIIDLHEDSTVEYSYIYRYIKEDPTFVHSLQAELEATDCPWDDDPSWEGASECHARAHGARLGATLEAPPIWPIEKRVQWHTRGLDFAIAHLPEHLTALSR